MAHTSNFTVAAYMGLFTIEFKVVGDHKDVFDRECFHPFDAGRGKPEVPVEISFTLTFSHILNWTRLLQICQAIQKKALRQTTKLINHCSTPTSGISSRTGSSRNL
ncbi:hypothetical protein AVEN_26265-1 [Araneus ventricosus]|uniref:Uncharacterized protein n=1 Tax=Araneus ventricosus TaxID=182803 RepID=A0A4Y2AMA1_ARAVE|nr:hypothetical protein AVEN_26265-1 [Araneus ventricosus]